MIIMLLVPYSFYIINTVIKKIELIIYCIWLIYIVIEPMDYVKKLDWYEFKTIFFEKNEYKNITNYILNEENILINKGWITETLYNYRIDYVIKDINLFHVAMTHSSYIYKDWALIKNFKMIFMSINVLGGDALEPISKKYLDKTLPIRKTSYERLEFLGDSVLRQIISDYLFVRYPTMQEGDLTKLRSQLENGSSLAELTRKIGLNKYVLISRNYEIIRARERNEKIQCDIFEAFIAALYLDASNISLEDIGTSITMMKRDRGIGYEICYKFVTTLIEDEIDLTTLLEVDTNYKDKLLQHYHDMDWCDPTYGIMETIVDPEKMGKKYFKMYVRDNNKNIIGYGVGSSKQKGEKLAAKRALQTLNIIGTTIDEEIELCCTDEIINHKSKMLTIGE